MFLFPRPPSCHIMPLQNDRFPSKHIQDGLALWFSFSFFFSNMQLKTLDSSKLLGFLTPIMWFLPKNTGTHTQRENNRHTHTHTENNIHDHLLICFLMVLSLETDKNAANNSVALLPSIWFLDARLVYYKMGILKLITQSGFGFLKPLRAPRSQFFIYKLDPR